MFDRRFFAELAAIVAAAVLCAGIANFFAARERKLALVGSYSKALEVPERKSDPLPELPVATPESGATAVSTPVPSPVPAPAAAPATPPAATSGPLPAKSAPSAPLAAKVFRPHPDKAFVEISGDDAVALWKQKTLFFDARRSADFVLEHIPGARSVSVWEADVESKVRAFAGEGGDTAAPIVVYCTGGNCEDSHMLAEQLFQVGFNNALVYRDGFPDWLKRKMPTEKGEAK